MKNKIIYLYLLLFIIGFNSETKGQNQADTIFIENFDDPQLLNSAWSLFRTDTIHNQYISENKDWSVISIDTSKSWSEFFRISLDILPIEIKTPTLTRKIFRSFFQ